MNSDLQSSPSGSSEGQRVAPGAWDAYVAHVQPAIRLQVHDDVGDKIDGP